MSFPWQRVSQLCFRLRHFEADPDMTIAWVVGWLHTLRDTKTVLPECWCSLSTMGCRPPRIRLSWGWGGWEDAARGVLASPASPSSVYSADTDENAELLVEWLPVDFDTCVALDYLIGSPGLGHHQSKGTEVAQFNKGFDICQQPVHRRKCQHILRPF